MATILSAKNFLSLHSLSPFVGPQYTLIAQEDTRVSLAGDLGQWDYKRSRLLVPAMFPSSYYLATLVARAPCRRRLLPASADIWDLPRNNVVRGYALDLSDLLPPATLVALGGHEIAPRGHTGCTEAPPIQL
jgi:hypothetical protein